MIETPQPLNAIKLTGAPEQLGKAIYRLLCGKKEEAKEDEKSKNVY